MGILTPLTSKSLKFFKFQLEVHDYVPEIYTSAIFHFNPFSGASPQIGEINCFVKCLFRDMSTNFYQNRFLFDRHRIKDKLARIFLRHWVLFLHVGWRSDQSGILLWLICVIQEI